MDRSDPKLSVAISFNDETGEPVAAYLRIREGTVATTREIQEGVAFADFATNGLLLGIELLEPCSVEVLDRLVKDEPKQSAVSCGLGFAANW